jgi:hypothetical protein
VYVEVLIMCLELYGVYACIVYANKERNVERDPKRVHHRINNPSEKIGKTI